MHPLAAFVLVSVCRPGEAADPADSHPDLHLVPWPKSVRRDAGFMPLTPESRVVAAEDRLAPLADVLAGEIETVTGLKLAVVKGPGRAGDVVLRINPEVRAGEKILTLKDREVVRTTDGAHTVTVTDRATVEGFDYRAAAEGTATVLQLLGKSDGAVRLPKITIHDWPHADYCGAMLDVARQDHPIEAIKQVVQLCRLYKARYLQLHLTDDQGWTFPSTRFPKLGTKNYGAHGGIAPRVYKLEELKALVAYADARGVALVPEFEMPGHSGAAVRAMPELFDAIDPASGKPVGIGCMNMSNEALYPALDTLVGEMADVFRSSPYFHIGSDEVTTGRLSLNPGYQAFVAKHGLKDEHELANHFVAALCAMAKEHGKKAIEWEGLANTATKDVIVMAWEGNSTAAGELLARGYTTITCPWNLGVLWEQWNMYVCNGSRLKKGDAVLGATLVAWEQPPATHVANLRHLAARQERTWGPGNAVTEAGLAARFQPLDAVAGKLIGLPPKARLAAAFASSAGAAGFLDPVFAFDGSEATFFQTGWAPKAGDHFTVTFPEARLVYDFEVLTGVNGRGRLDGGQVQVSADGTTFATVATLDKGVGRAVLKDPRVKAVRLVAAADQAEALVVREVRPRLLVELTGVVRNPPAAVGEGNVAAIADDAEFAGPAGDCTFPLVNRGHTLKVHTGGRPATIAGLISGTGTVEMHAGGPDAQLVLTGKDVNTMAGTWAVRAGRVVLAKEPGTDAMGGTVRVGGTGEADALVWNAGDQLNDAATVELLGSAKGGAALILNGHSDTFAKLSLAAGARVLTDGPAGAGVLTVREVVVEGKSLPRGVYAAPAPWLRGSGYVIVGDVKRVPAAGTIDDPARAVGAGNLAELSAATTFKLPEGECAVAVDTRTRPLTLAAGGDTRYSGFVTGGGSVRVELPAGRSLELAGPAGNAYKGPTTLGRGVLKLNKPAGAIAIPGDLVLGGSAAENDGDAVVWQADGQVAASANVTVQGTWPAALDLNGHTATVAGVRLSKAGVIRTGKGGTLRARQLHVDGRRLADGTYRAPQPWLEGTGTVTVDCRVDVKGVIGNPESAIGAGNTGNLTGDTKIGYPSAGGDFDVATNGHTLTLDSGDGNAFAFTGAVSGAGDVVFLMGPSHTAFRDAPMVLGGPKPNTATGTFRVKKGRVRLEKPEGTDAVSGDVVVGGQGFNDCLFWAKSHQLRDTVTITLLDAGPSGSAYLHLNGCEEAAAGLTMTGKNRVVTDSPMGNAGALTVKALTIDGLAQPAGTYAAANAKWVEGKGKVVVRP